ncbi:MAG: HK97 gp10 family phage protein [Paracoccaceae bacterium]|nr:HK97 gp10 family phage protein [Paracoccaceae bacterium]
MKTAFSGGRELEQALRELKRATAKAVGRRVLKKAGQIFADRANDLAPEGPGHHLKGSYVVGTKLTRRQAGMARREGRDDVTVYAGTSDPAGMQQEFGNERHGPQAHARPAWDQTQQNVFEVVQEGMAAEVEKTVARQRRRAAKAAKRNGG